MRGSKTSDRDVERAGAVDAADVDAAPAKSSLRGNAEGMASPSVEKRARALGGTGSKTLGKQVKDVVSIVDVYRVRPRRPSLIGGLVSVAVIPATAVFVWALYADLKTSPPVESQEIMWTYDEGPYKAPLRCEAPGGCWVSNAYGDDSHHPSGLVASEKDCFFLGYKENTTVHLAYSFEPFEGLSVLAERPTPANPNFQVASILSDMNYWKGQFIDNEGVMPLWSYAMGGTTTVTLVITHNETLTGVGAKRTEFFLQHISSEDTITPGTTGNVTKCDHNVTSTTHLQTRFRLAPEFYKVTVRRAWKSYLAFFGASAGVWAAFVAWGSIIVATSESFRGAWRAAASGGAGDGGGGASNSVLAAASSRMLVGEGESPSIVFHALQTHVFTRALRVAASRLFCVIHMRNKGAQSTATRHSFARHRSRAERRRENENTARRSRRLDDARARPRSSV